MPPRVFISYRREDGSTLAERLALELQSRRITVFYDSDSIALSDAWRRKIDQGLDEMDALILVLTKKALESDEVQSEWNDALSQKKRVFCLVVPEVPDNAVPSRLKIVNYARIASEDDFLAALARILLEIRKPAVDVGSTASPPALDSAAAATPPAPPATDKRDATVAGDWPWNLKGGLEGRDDEAVRLSRLLADPGTSLVGITGRAGIGKTALTCRVLDSVRQRTWLHDAAGPAIDGIAILGSRTGGLSLDRLIQRCSQLLGEHGHRIDFATTLSVEEKVGRLLDSLSEGTFILLFDHLDDLIDSKGQLVDAGLRTCFEEFLKRPQSVRLVFTCREPLDLPADAQPFARQYPLEGLPSDAGIAMLRALDPDGRKQLRAAGTGMLADTVRRLHGVPRALQLFASLIERDPFFDWAEWLDRSGIGRGFLDDLIGENYARLTDDERHLLQAFAVFRAPVPVSALRHLLGDRPDDATLRESLARLWRARMVGRHEARGAAADPPARRRSELRFSIHATDQDYVYSHLPASGEWSKPSLERKVAAYYRSIRPPQDAWRTRDGLEPLVLEFDHLLKASEFADAAGILDLIDDYLVLTGRAYKCREMWLALDGNLTEPRAVARHLLGLGLIDIRLGAIEEGRARLVKGKTMIAGKDNVLEGELTGWLGESARRLGRFDESFDYSTEAVRLCEAAGNRAQVARWKCELSLLSSYRGDPKSAIAVAMESLALSREAGNAPFEALALDALALGWLVAGRPAEAISSGRQALTHYEGSVWEPTRMYVLNVVGLACAMAGRSGAAIDELERARALADDHHDARVQGLVQFNMARVRRQQGQLPAARQELDRAIATFDRLNAGERQAAHAFARVLDAVDRSDDRALASALVECARDSMSWPDILVPVDLLDEAALLIAKLGDERLDSERAGLSARIDAVRAL